MQKAHLIPGHEDTACEDCHLEHPGSLRQELQANVKYALGLRTEFVPIGYQQVTSQQCVACHDRKGERHPIYRFQEPRFAQAVSQIDARSCLSCHSEHVAERVTHPDIGFCSACHGDLDMKQDPLDVSHAQIIANKDWNSCMGCHSYHGNHTFSPPVRKINQFSEAAIRAYLRDAPSPYGSSKIEKGKSP